MSNCNNRGPVGPIKHYGVSPSIEVFIPLPNGCAFVFPSHEANEAGCDYVRIVAEDGGEIAYWNCDEWEESPVEVMGAICGAMMLRPGNQAKLNYYRFAPDCEFPPGVEVEELIEDEDIEVDEEGNQVTTCARCGSDLKDHLCTDQTCPFSTHRQSCSMGWAGHPDYGHEATKCACKN